MKTSTFICTTEVVANFNYRAIFNFKSNIVESVCY